MGIRINKNWGDKVEVEIKFYTYKVLEVLEGVKVTFRKRLILMKVLEAIQQKLKEEGLNGINKPIEQNGQSTQLDGAGLVGGAGKKKKNTKSPAESTKGENTSSSTNEPNRNGEVL